jgi:hypothetical protein
MVGIFYALGFALALSCFLDLRVTDTERLFSFAIVRVLLSLPLLAGVYIYVSLNLQYQLIAPLFFVENVFTLIWFFMAYRLHQTSVPADSVSKTLGLSFVVAGTAAVGAGSYGLFNPPAAEILEGFILFPSYGYLYFSSVFMLVALFAVVWRLEIFWRALDQRKRWQFKYLVIGIFLVCGSLFWLISYRLLYRRLAGEHHLLAALLLLIAWFCTVYAVLRHRLLNRKLFLSRQVIYSAVAPITFAGYLILFNGY